MLRRRPTATAGRSLTERASLTAIASLLDYGSRLAVGLVLTPLIVGYLGRSLFGAWEILMRIVGYMSMADGRPMDALRLVLANRQSTVDEDTNRRTIGMAVTVWVLFLPFVVVAGALIVWLGPIMAKASADRALVIRLTAGLLVLNFVVATLVALPEAVLFGMNQGYRRMGLVASANVLGGLLTFAAIRARFGLIGLAAAQVAVTLLTATVFLLLARKYIPWFGIARPSRQEIRWFAGFSGWSLAGDSISKLLLASDVVILGLFASAPIVTSYVLTGYAAQAVVGVLTLTLGAVVPGLAGVIGQREYSRAATLRCEMLSLGWLAGTVVGCAILLWNRSFLRLWVGSEHYAGSWSNMLLVLIMVQTIFIRSDAYVINAALRVRERVLISASAVVLSCALSAILVQKFGITGLCLSVLGGRLTQSIAFPILINRTFGRRGSFGLAAILRPGLATALLFAMSAAIGQRVLVDSWTMWVVGAGISVLTVLPIAAVAGLAPGNRTPLITRLKSVPNIAWASA